MITDTSLPMSGRDRKGDVGLISARRGQLWYKDAVIYAIDVGTFMDSDGDGIGDFAGLQMRLDYLASLGVTCLWLLPFFPTPNRDNGYDVMDYYGVDPRLGSLGDFVAFMHEATSRGLHVIVDLVVHHTSDQHHWFQEARVNRDSKYRDYFVWTDDPPEETSAVLVFPGIEDSVWTYDEASESYYLHQFYDFQPDLNVEHPAVREEIGKIIGLWLELGASGFRVDAASHMLGTDALGPETERQPHEFLRYLRDAVVARYGSAVLIAEADVEQDQLSSYFGDGDEMHLLYNFLLDNYLFLAFAREEAEPIAQALHMLPDKPEVGQWANFLRNLDELDLERLSDDERQEVYTAFAPKEGMRIYGRGIRRRLAPMLGGDRQRLELAYSLLFSLPGTPVLAYGDEIGMGDDLSLPERQSVRTPMQWSGEANGGFSTAPVENLPRPVIGDGEYGYQNVNVVAQRRDRDSLLNWIQHVIQVRRQSPEIGWGDYTILKTDQPGVFAHRCDWEGGTVVAMHNLASEECTVVFEHHDELPRPIVEIFGNREYEEVGETLHHADLDAHGYRWFRCGSLRL